MKKLLADLLIVVLSVVFAIYIVRVGAVDALLSWAGNGILLASFIAGMCFTSVFTTAPAIAVFAELSSRGSIFLIAGVGGLGAMLVDLVLFSFVRYRVAKDAALLLKGPRWRGLRHVLRNRHMRRFLPVVGAIIVASPFPDEIGLALMGVSKLSTPRFLLIAYSMNVLGILGIGFVSRIL